MKNLWLINGLGSDERVFRQLNFGSWNPVYMGWLKPTPHESLINYSKRFSEIITDKEPSIIGYSFGGMLAIEIAKQIPVKQVILISSAKTRQELPPSYRLASHLPFLFPFFPIRLLAKIKPFHFWQLGAQNQAEYQLLTDYLKNADYPFLKWAMEAIIQWSNTTIPPNVIHLHGTSDRVLPFKYIRQAKGIPGGSHLMILDTADQLNQYLKEILKNPA